VLDQPDNLKDHQPKQETILTQE